MKLQRKIILRAIEEKTSARNFSALKQRVASAMKKSLPSNQSILKEYRKLRLDAPFLEKILRTREIRTLSGVAVVTVLTKPWPCPGACVYCPSDPRMPKSYLPDEPAAARALSLKFNPFAQVAKRIEALEMNGHPVDKIELIVKGGTWSAYPQKYRDWFIKRCFEAANAERHKVNSLPRRERGREDLSSAQKINETAKHRIVGLTLETRPDCVTPEEIKHMRELGCTRVELGVQTIDDKILKLIHRGHTTKQTAEATAMLRNAGFKVDYHLMPALPGVSPKKDLENFKKIFSDPRFRPDMIKIYPCSIIPDTILHRWWKQGKYKPLSDKKLAELIIRMKLAVPPYARISRVIRDIPGDDIAAGSKNTSLRQNIQSRMESLGLKCRCIRCREIGRQQDKFSIINFQLSIKKYKTSDGTEYFLSIENPQRDALFAFCRLRLPIQNSKFKIQNLPEIRDAALIRELHTYGHLMPVGKKSADAPQHTGFGKKLMKEAEKIAKNAGYKKMAVISGVGVREYYRKIGYGIKGTYMVKNI